MTNIDQFITQSKRIIETRRLGLYLDILFNYWASEPPTLGHGFVKYQQRAWEIFYKYRNFVEGMDKPIGAYLSSYQEFAKNYFDNQDFIMMLKKYATEYKDLEDKVLNTLFTNRSKILNIVSNGDGL